MTVYVDDMYKYPIGRYGRMKMSHMITDGDEEELHKMADAIGVRRKWYQGDHYDVCMEARVQALHLGAKNITYRQLGCMRSLKARGLPMGDPETAPDRFKKLVYGKKSTK